VADHENTRHRRFLSIASARAHGLGTLSLAGRPA
jgi:hypothetical protein